MISIFDFFFKKIMESYWSKSAYICILQNVLILYHYLLAIFFVFKSFNTLHLSPHCFIQRVQFVEKKNFKTKHVFSKVNVVTHTTTLSCLVSQNSHTRGSLKAPWLLKDILRTQRGVSTRGHSNHFNI